MSDQRIKLASRIELSLIVFQLFLLQLDARESYSKEPLFSLEIFPGTMVCLFA